MEFKDRLKALRKQMNLTQDEFTKKSGIGRSAVSMYESGKRMPSYDVLCNIADFFNVTTDYLLGKTNDTVASPKKPTTDLLDALFHDEPELLAKARNIDIKGKINEPGMVAKLTEHQKARLKDIIMFTIDEAIRNGQRTLVRIHSSKEGSGDHANTQSN